MSTLTTNLLIVFGIFTAILILIIILAKRKQLHMAYTIDAGGEKIIKIITNAKWRETEIWFDGSLAVTLSQKELFSGYDLQISDGSALNFKLVKHYFQPHRLQITRNGQPISNILTGYDNQMIVNGAGNIMHIIAVMNLIVGIVSIFIKIEAFAPLVFGWQNIAFGLIFLILGFFTRRRSVVAMVLFILIFGLDSIPLLILSLQTGHFFVILVFLMRLIFIAPVFLGLSEIFRRKAKPVSMLFSIVGVVLMIVAMIGMFAILIWSISKVVTSWNNLTTFFPKSERQSVPLPVTLEVRQDGSCHLRIKDTAKTVNIRDIANSSTGKVVDYLDINDVAAVLGTNGGSPGNEWWFIEVTHKGITNQGWVTSKWVELDNSQNCSKLQQLVTPFP